MEEYQVSVDGNTRRLPEPFFVVATQNPADQIGTFPLPESQLDRFLMRLELGYPNEESERELIAGEDRRTMLKDIEAVASPETLIICRSGRKRSHERTTRRLYTGAGSTYARVSRHRYRLVASWRPGTCGRGKARAFVENHSGVYPMTFRLCLRRLRDTA